MGIEGFEGNLPEESKMPLQSEAWQKDRDGRPAKYLAEEKLKKEMKEAKDKPFAEPVIGYLLKRCQEDEGLAEDVIQEHKSWQKCLDFIYGQARKQTKGNCAFVRDDVVYEWAEDYYHKDDKAEEAEKEKKAAEDKAKRKKSAAERKAVKAAADNDKMKKVSVPPKAKVSETPPKLEKSENEMDGQLDMFSLLGMS